MRFNYRFKQILMFGSDFFHFHHEICSTGNDKKYGNICKLYFIDTLKLLNKNLFNLILVENCPENPNMQSIFRFEFTFIKKIITLREYSILLILKHYLI